MLSQFSLSDTCQANLSQTRNSVILSNKNYHAVQRSPHENMIKQEKKYIFCRQIFPSENQGILLHILFTFELVTH